MTARILDGKAVAADILEGVAADVGSLKESGWAPRLVSIKVGEDPAVDLYIRNQRRNATRVGIEFDECHYPANITIDELRAAVAVSYTHLRAHET